MIQAILNQSPKVFGRVHRKTQACNFIEKEALALMFSCEFSDIFKRKPPVTASQNADITVSRKLPCQMNFY